MASCSSAPTTLRMSPPLHFFKIILESSLEDRKLVLPKKLVAEYGRFLPNCICLKLPDSLEWNVGLTKGANGAVWLQHGWHLFSEHYGLKFGWFLVFRFDGNSTFHTLIFDLTGLEIQYGHNQNRTPLLSPKTEAQTQPFASVVDQPQQTYGKVGFKVEMPKSFLGDDGYNMCIPTEFAKRHLEKFGKIRVENSEGMNWEMEYKWGKRHYNVDYAYISSGWKSFAQQNQLKGGDTLFFHMIKNHHFSFTFQPPAATQISSFQAKINNKAYKSRVLNIPVVFGKDHLSVTMNAAILVVGSMQWKVKLKQYNNYFKLLAGWPAFFMHNSLEAGDTCLFQMVHKAEFHCVFEVVISKKTSTLTLG